MASESIRLVAKLIQDSVQNQDSNSSKELTTMMVVNKENNSADLNSAKNLSEKELSESDQREFSPRPNLPGFTSSNNHNKSSSQSPPLPARINLPASTLTSLPVLHSSSKASPSTSTMSSPGSSVCSPGFGSKSPPISITPGNDLTDNKLSSRGSAFNLTGNSGLIGGQRDVGTHLLSQHLLELNQMRPLPHQSQTSPPYKFFQDNSFYQSRPLMNGNDLSEFKLNVQMKEKQTALRETFVTTASETSEEVVVDGNDDTADDSQQNTVSG